MAHRHSRNGSRSLSRFVALLALAGAACLTFAAAAPDLAYRDIITTKFTSGDTNSPLDGTQDGLDTNLPGAKWIWGAGWNWGAPHTNATWMGDALQNAADLSEEKTALALSLASAGTYTKPTKMHIEATLAVAQGADGGAIGFWSAVPERKDDKSAITGFTGVNVKLNGDLQIIENGAAVGIPVPTEAINSGTPYVLVFDVNTKTGEISNLKFDNKTINGFTSKAFTDTATAFVGVMSSGGARTILTSLEVSEIPDP